MTDRTLTWVDWTVADKTPGYPRKKSELVSYDELVFLVRQSGVRICGHCHQHAPASAPMIDGVGIALSMRSWGEVMFSVEHPDVTDDATTWNAMGYCQWAWGNPGCQSCQPKRMTP